MSFRHALSLYTRFAALMLAGSILFTVSVSVAAVINGLADKRFDTSTVNGGTITTVHHFLVPEAVAAVHVVTAFLVYLVTSFYYGSIVIWLSVWVFDRAVARRDALGLQTTSHAAAIVP